MKATMLETISSDTLAGVMGGKEERGFWDRAKNLGKAAVNGAVNVANAAIPDQVQISAQPGGVGVAGTWNLPADPIPKPFKDDPLAKARGDS